MKFLVDTHLMLWAAADHPALSATARALLQDPDNEFFFSPVSLWEVVIKNALGQPDFRVDPRVLHRSLLDAGYQELDIGSEHVLFIASLPPLHKDPFDRLLIAQAASEGITLLTVDEQVASYPCPVRRV